MLSIGLPDHQIGGALQQSKERNEKEEEPAPETAEAEFQG
jgi:hypothetical protein